MKHDEKIMITEFPVFERDVFYNNPDLFNPYFRNVPVHQERKYQKARDKLPRYEERFKWQSINGPGFCGAIHPGTGKVFHGAMTDSTHPIYNSDCLYINPAKNIFAVSDPPGITEFSRNLLTKLDQFLKHDSADNLESMINEVNRNAGTGLRDRATLSLVYFPTLASGKANFLLCGDSHLFHGNIITRRISRLEAEPNRWGTLNAVFKLKQIDIEEGDFLILASDGIGAVRSLNETHDLDNMLLNMVISDSHSFALDVTRNCNQIIKQRSAGITRTTFGCGDDLSIILIEPEKLQPMDSHESYILGGYIDWKS